MKSRSTSVIVAGYSPARFGSSGSHEVPTRHTLERLEPLKRLTPDCCYA